MSPEGMSASIFQINAAAYSEKPGFLILSLLTPRAQTIRESEIIAQWIHLASTLLGSFEEGAGPHPEMLKLSMFRSLTEQSSGPNLMQSKIQWPL